MVSVYIKVASKSKKLIDIKFESYGCASNIATGSIITELAKGRTLDEAKKITWQQASKALGGLPKIKAHCSVLAVEGLRAAIQNYEERQGLVTKKVKTTKEVVRRRLKKVMNPISGLDLVRTNLVRDIKVQNGSVEITVELPPQHQFAPAIREEIKEKIEPLWDVKSVLVNFGD
jgi:metal-sulfur cluster biosynthetic enzyme